MNGVVRRSIEAAKSHASPCASDADCTLAPLELSCYSGCGSPILKTEQAAYATELVSIDQAFCPRGCRVSAGCPPLSAVCSNGACVHQF